jgi:hypothetical protein
MPQKQDTKHTASDEKRSSPVCFAQASEVQQAYKDIPDPKAAPKEKQAVSDVQTSNTQSNS